MLSAKGFLFAQCCIVFARALRPKHVVLVVADDLGWNDVQWRDNAVLTPTLNALASAGVVLSNYYTHEVCSPTRGSILTGRFAYRLGYQGVISSSQAMGLPLSVPTLPELLNHADPALEAHCVGKWHLGLFCDAMLPTARGFQSYFGYLDGAESYTAHGNNMGFCGSSTDRANSTGPSLTAMSEQATNVAGSSGPFALDLWNGTAPARDWDGVYSSTMYSRIIGDKIEQHDPNKPLFLYAAFQNVHEPIDAPDAFRDLYVNSTNSSSRALFSADVSALDDAVANLTRNLQARGMWNDTLLIFTTDNGANLHGGGNNWPLRGGKWSTWEGGIRGTAFVVHGALAPSLILEQGTQDVFPSGGIVPGPVSLRNVSRLMHAADWLPTIFDALGLNLSTHAASLDGQSAWHAIAGALEYKDGDNESTDTGVGGANEGRVIVHKMSAKAVNSSAFSATVRVGDLKLLVGFPGDDKSTTQQTPPCRGGCWCPVPDPQTGMRTCVRLDVGSSVQQHDFGVGVGKDPPSAQCAAACAAVPDCGSMAKTSRSACAMCLLSHNATLATAGCRTPPAGRDLKHWCNNLNPGPSPAPAPVPSPGPVPTPWPPMPKALPCTQQPCLFNITHDPLETIDLAPTMPDKVQELLTLTTELQAKLMTSPFPGGHQDAEACAALKRSGMWGPWVTGPHGTCVS